MRTRRCAAFVLASAAALGGGPVRLRGQRLGRDCIPAAPNPTAGNQSCVNGPILPNTGLRRHVQERQPVHPRGDEVPASGQPGPGRVREDGDGALRQRRPDHPGDDPERAPRRDVANKTIPQAYAACGPGRARTPTCRRRARSAARHPPRRRRTSAAARWCSRARRPTRSCCTRGCSRCRTRIPACTTQRNGGGNVTIVLVGTISNAGVRRVREEARHAPARRA